MKTKGKLTVVLLGLTFILSSCDRAPVPEKLPLSVRANLNLLLKDAQFVMYMNFKSMRSTDFWKQNLSDSIITGEQTFGSILNLFGKATGATISNGLDELYYANSWFGENSIVLKGVFNKDKLDGFIAGDSNFTKIRHSDGTEIYKSINDNLFFYLKDNVTLCASNYQSQLDRMMKTTDTSNTGVLENEGLMKAIEGALYKKDLMMVSTEKMFIRGVFLNFLGGDPTLSGLGSGKDEGTPMDQPEGEGELGKIYEDVKSIAFSVNMESDMKLMVQCECINEESANKIRKLVNGLLTFSKLGSAFKNEDEKSATEEMLNNIDVKNYETNVIIEIKVTEENIAGFRNKSFIEESPTP
jgi:hypothetical protein